MGGFVEDVLLASVAGIMGMRVWSFVNRSLFASQVFELAGLLFLYTFIVFYIAKLSFEEKDKQEEARRLQNAASEGKKEEDTDTDEEEYDFDNEDNKESEKEDDGNEEDDEDNDDEEDEDVNDEDVEVDNTDDQGEAEPEPKPFVEDFVEGVPDAAVDPEDKADTDEPAFVEPVDATTEIKGLREKVLTMFEEIQRDGVTAPRAEPIVKKKKGKRAVVVEKL